MTQRPETFLVINVMKRDTTGDYKRVEHIAQRDHIGIEGMTQTRAVEIGARKWKKDMVIAEGAEIGPDHQLMVDDPDHQEMAVANADTVHL